MAKLEENVMLSEWVSPSASPRTIMGGFIVGSQEQMFNQDIKREDVAAANGGQWTELGSNNEQKSSLLQRRAARAGFNAPMLDTENISCTRVSLNQDQAPYITVSPGLSPTTLLESSVFLSNSLAPSSPTTGKISFIQNGNVKSSMLLPDEPDERNDNTYEDIGASPFPFKTESGSDPSLYFCALGAGNEVTSTTSLPQSCRGIGILSHPENMLQSYGAEPPKVQSETKNSLYYSSEFPKLVAGKDRIGDSIQQPDHIELEAFGGHVKHSPTSDEQPDEGGQRGSGESMAPAGGTPSEDGYNWRKYGQKQVKGSEYPRSYYKCTHLNCPVKKKVERSHEGHITEIIYKGAHNHPKPLPNRRAGIGLSNPLMDLPLDASEQTLPVIGSDGNPLWPNMHDNLEVTSKASLEHEFGHPSSSMKALNGTNSADAAAASSTFSNDDDDDEDRATHGSVGYGGEDDEFDSKRRKLDSYPSEIGGTNRALREPRIVVQVSTDVDILEDGYRWRKYGQKVVKGNPNPRSYYKCTSAGCTVRKHVERASHDLKAVITTYEGKHNHDVPAARNSSHVNPTNSSTMPVHTMNAVQSHIQRPETSQVHNSMARYDLPAAFGPPYGLPGRQQLRSTPNYPYGMNQPGLANLTMAGLGPRQSKMPSMPVHPLIAQHQPLSEMGFMMPKPELKVEPVTEPNLNLENTPSVYQQIMNRLPLGP